jgi:hypothetical protein
MYVVRTQTPSTARGPGFRSIPWNSDERPLLPQASLRTIIRRDLSNLRRKGPSFFCTHSRARMSFCASDAFPDVTELHIPDQNLDEAAELISRLFRGRSLLRVLLRRKCSLGPLRNSFKRRISHSLNPKVRNLPKAIGGRNVLVMRPSVLVRAMRGESADGGTHVSVVLRAGHCNWEGVRFAEL